METTVEELPDAILRRADQRLAELCQRICHQVATELEVATTSLVRKVQDCPDATPSSASPKARVLQCPRAFAKSAAHRLKVAFRKCPIAMGVALSTEAPAEASGSVVAPTEAFESAVVPGVKLHANACEGSTILQNDLPATETGLSEEAEVLYWRKRSTPRSAGSATATDAKRHADPGEAGTLVLENDLHAAIEASFGDQVKVLYPNKSHTFTFLSSTSNILKVCLRDDPTVSGTQVVNLVNGSSCSSQSCRTSQSFGSFGVSVAEVLEKEEEEVQREQRVLQERKQRVQKKLDKERCENVLCCFPLFFFCMFLSFTFLILCILMEPHDVASAVLLSLAVVVLLGCVALNGCFAQQFGVSFSRSLWKWLAYHGAYGCCFLGALGVAAAIARYMMAGFWWSVLIAGLPCCGLSTCVCCAWSVSSLEEEIEDMEDMDKKSVAERTIVFHGSILEGKGPCVSSWPGKYESAWDALWINNIEEAVQQGAELEVYFFAGMKGKGKVQHFLTAGQEHMRREAIQGKKKQFLKSGDFCDALHEGIDGLRKEPRGDSSSQYSREVHRLFLASLSEEDRNFLEASEGLGNSQKAEVAWLDKKGYAYTEASLRMAALAASRPAWAAPPTPGGQSAPSYEPRMMAQPLPLSTSRALQELEDQGASLPLHGLAKPKPSKVIPAGDSKQSSEGHNVPVDLHRVKTKGSGGTGAAERIFGLVPQNSSDEQPKITSQWRLRVQEIIRNSWFDCFVMSMVLLHSLLTGIQIHAMSATGSLHPGLVHQVLTLGTAPELWISMNHENA
eukprot:s1038_g16.t3